MMRSDFPEPLQDLDYAIREKFALMRDHYMYFSFGPLPEGPACTPKQLARLAEWDKFMEEHSA